MTKRVRGPARTHKRPGTRPPTERPAGTRRRETTSLRSSQLEIADEIAEEVIEATPAGTMASAPVRATTRTVPPATSARLHHKIKAGSLLATRAATEYVYVAQDMRRITAVAVLLTGGMFVLWLLVVILKVIALPFY